MEGIKGSSLVGETTTVVAAVITITTTGNTTIATTMVNTTMATTTVNMEMVNTTMDNITMDNTTTATTTMDSEMEVDASVTTDYPSETSMGTHMEPVEGRTTRGGPGATPRAGATPGVGICKPQNVFQATRGLIGPVGIMDKMILILGSVEEINKVTENEGNNKIHVFHGLLEHRT